MSAVLMPFTERDEHLGGTLLSYRDRNNNIQKWGLFSQWANGSEVTEYALLVSQITTNTIPSCILFLKIKWESIIKVKYCYASKIFVQRFSVSGHKREGTGGRRIWLKPGKSSVDFLIIIEMSDQKR